MSPYRARTITKRESRITEKLAFYVIAVMTEGGKARQIARLFSSALSSGRVVGNEELGRVTSSFTFPGSTKFSELLSSSAIVCSRKKALWRRGIQ